MGLLDEMLDNGALTFFPFMKPGLVTALCPALDVLVDEAGIAELLEVGADFLIGDAIIEPLVNLSAGVVRKLGDFAGQTAGRFNRSELRKRKRVGSYATAHSLRWHA